MKLSVDIVAKAILVIVDLGIIFLLQFVLSIGEFSPLSLYPIVTKVAIAAVVVGFLLSFSHKRLADIFLMFPILLLFIVYIIDLRV